MYGSDPMDRVRSTIETIDAGTAAAGRDAVKWCRAWRDTLVKIGPAKLWEADKACRRALTSQVDAVDKELARRCLHLLRDGWRMAKMVDEVDRDLADLYPATKAKVRLDTELGWEEQPGDSIQRKLDRACMKIRVAHPDRNEVMRGAFAIVRSRFSTLEAGAE